MPVKDKQLQRPNSSLFLPTHTVNVVVGPDPEYQYDFVYTQSNQCVSDNQAQPERYDVTDDPRRR